MSKHYPLLQSFGALLVLDAESRRIQATSANLATLAGLGASSPPITLEQLLGRRLTQQVRCELQGQPRLAAPLVFSRGANRSLHFQLRAYRSGEHVLMELEPFRMDGQHRLLGALHEHLSRLAETTHQEELLAYLVTTVRTLTGFTRVAVCQFDPDWHGHIVAEAKADDECSIAGQRLAARDFPVALRRAYVRHPVRYIQDAQAPVGPLTPGDLSVDLSASVLRAPTFERQRYLERLGVRGMLNVSMICETGLWGVLFCHATAAHEVTAAVRDAVHILVQAATERLSLLRARHEARYLKRVQDSLASSMNTQQSPRGPEQLLLDQAATWMTLFRAQGVALWHAGGVYQAGKTPAPEVISQMVIRLRQAHPHNGPWCTRNTAKHSLTSSLAMPEQAGVMAIPLSMGHAQRAWLFFFRLTPCPVLHWSVRPVSAVALPVSGTLPTAWYEEVTGCSEAWQRVERLAAMSLGRDLTLAISSYEISMLNMHLERERKALASANQRLEQLAHFDPLTQIWNRYRIEQAIDDELVAAKRYGATFALLMFDVDHFKAINDTYGHSLGDEVLVALARRVESSLRGCDYFGRWGGEEFVILATHSDIQAAAGLAERLRELLVTLQLPGLDQPVTVSIGVVAWQPDDSCKTLMARADAAMYLAKRKGRNRVEVAAGEAARVKG
ncbi:diguanylate cyclase (GGDEF)-like protein [Vreelandella songnenensis]|uniref:diguanylate cyclase n=1 Tax=Vreelandella songnenensis TaxID=1176243 RepID=A0A2T0V316_9GAMM|nr:sensor domain-containing diguanylate cyclase [Halomonas songnenensis]PRY64560.1 diguanylate cyclase (GGDEF)-like protein [Halomonas songnenensis]